MRALLVINAVCVGLNIGSALNCAKAGNGWGVFVVMCVAALNAAVVVAAWRGVRA